MPLIVAFFNGDLKYNYKIFKYFTSLQCLFSNFSINFKCNNHYKTAVLTNQSVRTHL